METTYALNENKSLQEIKRPPRIGFIKTFAGATPPEGTLLCDGSSVSRDTYSDLFDVIGTTWGEGDGSTTFNLPDLRDQWILCAGTEHTVGEKVSEGLPNITGQIASTNILTASNSVPGVSGALSVTAAAGGFGSGMNGIQWFVLDFDASRSNAIYGASDHVTPKSTVFTPCIVYE